MNSVPQLGGPYKARSVAWRYVCGHEEIYQNPCEGHLSQRSMEVCNSFCQVKIVRTTQSCVECLTRIGASAKRGAIRQHPSGTAKSLRVSHDDTELGVSRRLIHKASTTMYNDYKEHCGADRRGSAIAATTSYPESLYTALHAIPTVETCNERDVRVRLSCGVPDPLQIESRRMQQLSREQLELMQSFDSTTTVESSMHFDDQNASILGDDEDVLAASEFAVQGVSRARKAAGYTTAAGPRKRNLQQSPRGAMVIKRRGRPRRAQAAR